MHTTPNTSSSTLVSDNQTITQAMVLLENTIQRLCNGFSSLIDDGLVTKEAIPIIRGLIQILNSFEVNALIALFKTALPDYISAVSHFYNQLPVLLRKFFSEEDTRKKLYELITIYVSGIERGKIEQMFSGKSFPDHIYSPKDILPATADELLNKLKLEQLKKSLDRPEINVLRPLAGSVELPFGLGDVLDLPRKFALIIVFDLIFGPQKGKQLLTYLNSIGFSNRALVKLILHLIDVLKPPINNPLIHEVIKALYRRIPIQPLPTMSCFTVKRIEGLDLVPVIGDGHCFYRAVTYYLSHGENITFLRNIVAANLEHNQDQYKDFITLETGQTIQEYIERVRARPEWAGQLEQVILARLLNRPIVVVGPDDNIRNRGDVEAALSRQGAGDPIFVRYDGISHYDALVLNDGLNSRAILRQLIQQEAVPVVNPPIPSVIERPAPSSLPPPSPTPLSPQNSGILEPQQYDALLMLLRKYKDISGGPGLRPEYLVELDQLIQRMFEDIDSHKVNHIPVKFVEDLIRIAEQSIRIARNSTDYNQERVSRIESFVNDDLKQLFCCSSSLNPAASISISTSSTIAAGFFAIQPASNAENPGSKKHSRSDDKSNGDKHPRPGS
ncbi:MAG: hypothetical protein A2X78_01835 [Gammaproteobacteria bacterium GWE2_37_16]|nr:MAG: hypothetical protein A2X78_01835 [Gammaproteobacteria bacterium GWE2_37_16]